MPRSCVGIFRNERIRSNPLHRNLTFWCVSFYLGAFGTVWLYETRYKTGRTSAKVRATKSHRNYSQRTHPIHPHWTLNLHFGVFRTIWMHSGPFCCLTKLGHNECTQSTPLDPKLMRSYDLGAFGTVWLPYQTRSQRMHTIHPSGP